MADPYSDSPPIESTGYPQDADLTSRLEGMQVDSAKIAALQKGGALAGALAQAIDVWEQSAAWNPYVTSGDEETRLFDPPTRVLGVGRRVPGSRRLDLRSGLLSLTSLTVAGSALVPLLDFYYFPSDGPSGGNPIRAIDFLMPQYGLPQTIAVTGVWGKVTTVPLHVKNAIVTYALSIAAPDLAFAISGGYLERKIGDSTKKFAGSGSIGPLDQQMKAWPASFTQVLRMEKRRAL